MTKIHNEPDQEQQILRHRMESISKARDGEAIPPSLADYFLVGERSVWAIPGGGHEEIDVSLFTKRRTLFDRPTLTRGAPIGVRWTAASPGS